MRWDEQRRCSQLTDDGQQCEHREDHEGLHESGLSNGHGNPWEHDRCFRFTNNKRCVLIHRHDVGTLVPSKISSCEIDIDNSDRDTLNAIRDQLPVWRTGTDTILEAAGFQVREVLKKGKIP